jgi:hypothetical protein
MLVRILSLLVLLSTFMHCSSGSPTENPEDKILARVHNKELKLSELECMFPQSASGQDSSLIIQAFVNRWIKDAVLQWESERNLPTDLNIDGLVRDYRASLVRSTYEKVLVEQLLDSVVTQTQLEDYYATNKNQYLLEKPIIRCYFIKVPYPTPEAEKLQNLWSNGSVKDTMALVDYSNRFAQIALLKSQSWYSLDEVAEQFPEGTLTADNVRSKQEFTQQDGQYRYYFRLFELKPRLEIAPLSYVERQARRIILHDRSRKVLEDAKEEIFQRELRRSNVETFTN